MITFGYWGSPCIKYLSQIEQGSYKFIRHKEYWNRIWEVRKEILTRVCNCIESAYSIKLSPSRFKGNCYVLREAATFFLSFLNTSPPPTDLNGSRIFLLFGFQSWNRRKRISTIFSPQIFGLKKAMFW